MSYIISINSSDYYFNCEGCYLADTPSLAHVGVDRASDTAGARLTVWVAMVTKVTLITVLARVARLTDTGTRHLQT